jgi:DNA-binding XRE family transcriptional regulator
MDELEAVRLADFEGIYQEAAAKRMNISRQTFGNIIKSAHQKIADALVNAKALRIEGGVVTMVEKLFNCRECKHEWSVPYGMVRPDECPQCGGSNVHRSFDDRGGGRREDLGEAEVNFADGGGIVQIVPLQRKTRRPRLKMRPVGRRRNCQQQRSD